MKDVTHLGGLMHVQRDKLHGAVKNMAGWSVFIDRLWFDYIEKLDAYAKAVREDERHRIHQEAA